MKHGIPGLLIMFLLFSSIAQAHPMGNFSINHHSTIRFETDRIAIRYVLDFAEIPTLQMHAVAAEEWVGGLRLQVNGADNPIHLNNMRSEYADGAGGLRTLRVTMDLSAEWDGTKSTVHFVDRNFQERIGWKEIVVAADGAAAFPQGNPFVVDRSNGLATYAPDLLSNAPSVTEVSVVAIRSDGQPPAALEDKAAFHGPIAGRDTLATILSAESLPLRMILFGVAVAFALGALHAMSPGHGKTVVAAYLVGNRGTARHALFLGAVVTFTHTIGVFALGLVTLFLSRYVVPERLFPWLGFVSGLLIVGIGVQLFRQRFGMLAHLDDHEHAIPEGLSVRSLLAMGFSGGIVPCPSALVVLLSSVALHRVGVGLLFIVAFSLGLASVLMAIGLLMVRAGQRVSRLNSRDGLAQFLPILSATVVTLIGIGIAFQSMSIRPLLSSTISFSSGGLFVLGLGLVLGLKHATDADHVVAVTTFVSQERSLLRSCSIGAFWGVGHTLSLAIAGLIVIVLKVNISEWLSARLEFLVAVMLVALGVRVLFQKRVVQTTEASSGHGHAHWTHFGLRPLLVGMVHGAAGSAALMLLVLSTIRSPLEAFLYILIFGFGSIVGMLAISLLLVLPFHWARGRMAASYQPIQLMAGLFSCVFGLYLGVHIWTSL